MADAAHRPVRAAVGRADLLRLLNLTSPAADPAQSNLPEWFALPGLALTDGPGFQRAIDAQPAPQINLGTASGMAPAPVASPSTVKTPLQVPYFWVAEHHASPEDEPPPESPPTPEPPSAQAMTRPAASAALPYAQAVRALPLLPLARLKAVLRQHLQQGQASRQPDWLELTRRVARLQALHPLPLRRHARWPANLVLALDRQARSLTPYVDDMDALARQLRRWLGHRAVEVAVLADDPAAPWSPWRADPARLPGPRAARLPDAWLLLVSDLGTHLAQTPAPVSTLVGRGGPRTALFADWFQRLAHQRTRVVNLAPLPSALWPVGASATARPVCWSGPTAAPGADGESASLRHLLALLAWWGQMSDTLLRACRLLLPQGTADATLEWQLWNHPDVQQGRGRWVKLRPEAQARHQAHLQTLPPDALVQAAQVHQVLMADSAEPDIHLNCLRMATLAPAVRPHLAPLLAQAQHYLRHDLPQQWQQTQAAQRQRLSIQAAMLVNLAPAQLLTEERSAFRQLTALAYDAELRRNEAVPLRPELGAVQPLAQTDAATRQILSMQLAQYGSRLRLQPPSYFSGQLLTLPFDIPSEPGLTVHAAGFNRWVRLTHFFTELLDLDEIQTDTCLLQWDTGELRLNKLPRPRWAESVCRYHHGLYASFTHPWGEGRGAHHAGAWQLDDVSTQHGFGLDEFGLRWDLDCHGVPLRLRYIAPGSFLMGSPATEKGRSNDEGPRHRVTLTEGYWLADTPCTQALWLAVAGGENQSDFKGDEQRPVEQVSWDDVQERFLPQLQALLPPGCEAVLPTEAQWEYACRAGTTTAYAWGDEADEARANYGGKVGKTTAVRRYAPNGWGLYDLHGNVWEWCWDGPRNYAEGEAVDPVGAVGDGPRVLRGGAWFYRARYARSAYRPPTHRDSRRLSFGFRVALRFKLQGPQAQARQAEPAGWGRGGSPTTAATPQKRRASRKSRKS